MEVMKIGLNVLKNLKS